MTARRWNVEDREPQVLEANRDLETRLMQVVTKRNLNVQLARDKTFCF